MPGSEPGKRGSPGLTPPLYMLRERAGPSSQPKGMTSIVLAPGRMSQELAMLAPAGLVVVVGSERAGSFGMGSACQALASAGRQEGRMRGSEHGGAMQAGGACSA